jgi:hypothetical protein
MGYIGAPLCSIWIITSDHRCFKVVKAKWGILPDEKKEGGGRGKEKSKRGRQKRKRKKGRKEGRKKKRKEKEGRKNEGEGEKRERLIYVICNMYLNEGWNIEVIIHNYRTQNIILL